MYSDILIEYSWNEILIKCNWYDVSHFDNILSWSIMHIIVIKNKLYMESSKTSIAVQDRERHSISYYSSETNSGAYKFRISVNS